MAVAEVVEEVEVAEEVVAAAVVEAEEEEEVVVVVVVVVVAGRGSRVRSHPRSRRRTTCSRPAPR